MTMESSTEPPACRRGMSRQGLVADQVAGQPDVFPVTAVGNH